MALTSCRAGITAARCGNCVRCVSIFDESGISSTQRTVSGLNYDTAYYWRVRAVNSSGSSSWSQVWSFTTLSDDTGSGDDTGNNGNGKGPKKSSPSDDEKNVSKKPTFKWDTVDDAESYTIQVSSTEESLILIEEEVYETQFTPGREFQPNSKYEWRVRATVNGTTEEWSDSWEFTTAPDEFVFEVETELNQNYPNPFNPTTQIRFNLTEAQDVSLKVYDMAGRLVATVFEGTVQAGSHEETFNAQSLASGIYFYRLTTNSEIITRKMTLMK